MGYAMLDRYSLMHPTGYHLPHAVKRRQGTAAQAVWDMYHAAMEAAGFDGSTPLYVASGLLTYLDQSGVRVRDGNWGAQPHGPRTGNLAAGQEPHSIYTP